MIKLSPLFLILLIVIIVAIVIILRGPKEYIIFGNYLIYQKQGNSYKQVETIDDEILNHRFTVTDGTTTKKHVELNYINNKFYLYDKNSIYIEMPNFRMATYKAKVPLANFKQNIIIDASNDKYITEFLQKKKTQADDYKGYLTTFDFDKDGKDEIIYEINNISLGDGSNSGGSYMFMVYNDSIVFSTPKLKKSKYSVMEIANLDNKKGYEIIVNKGTSDLKSFNDCYQIYNFEEGKLKLIKDCK